MEVALYARVSTPNQQQEGTIASQVHSLHLYIQQRGRSLLPTLTVVSQILSEDEGSPHQLLPVTAAKE
jgi:DNA invertase Pin-like site-specific DNA recombinase